MKENGLQVYSVRMGDFNINPVKACTMEEYSEIPDVVFVCVKYYSLQETLEFLKDKVDTHTIVIPILNVYGTGGKMQKELSCTVTDGCVYIFSMIEEPGVIRQGAPIFKMYFGFRKDQTYTKEQEDILKTVEKKLIQAGVEAYYTTQIEKDALQKFACVSPMGTAGMYYSAVAGDLMREGEMRETFLGLAREVEAVGCALGLHYDTSLEMVSDNVLKGLTMTATTSMQRDVLAGGLSEVDGLVHEMVRLGHELGVAVPNYEKISLWAKERGIR
jgi:2-dehydropantoate 2-reductase